MDTVQRPAQSTSDMAARRRHTFFALAAVVLASAALGTQGSVVGQSGADEVQPVGWPRSVEYELDALYTDDLRGPLRETEHVFRAASHDEWTDEELRTSAPEPVLCQVAYDRELWDADGGCDTDFAYRGPLDGDGVSPNPYVAPVDVQRLDSIPSAGLSSAEGRHARQLQIRSEDLHVSERSWSQTCDDVGFLNCAAEGDGERTRYRRIVTHLPSGVRLLDLDEFDGVVLHRFEVRAIGRGRGYSPPARAMTASDRRRP